MKIYFQDGKLIDGDVFDCTDLWKLDAAYGPSFCRRNLDFISKHYSDDTVYTNSLIALNNDYAWNDELGAPEVFLKTHNLDTDEYEWARIDRLTDKNLRKAHNLMRMYLAGSFETNMIY